MIQGIQSRADYPTTGHAAAVYSVLNGFGEQDVQLTDADTERLVGAAGPSTRIQFGAATSFGEAGRQLADSFTLNGRQSIAVRLICRQLDRICFDEQGTSQLCLFVGGEGRTGKSRVIEGVQGDSLSSVSDGNVGDSGCTDRRSDDSLSVQLLKRQNIGT